MQDAKHQVMDYELFVYELMFGQKVLGDVDSYWSGSVLGENVECDKCSSTSEVIALLAEDYSQELLKVLACCPACGVVSKTLIGVCEHHVYPRGYMQNTDGGWKCVICDNYTDD